MLTKEALNSLKQREFVNIATSGPGQRPNVAPKFLLKIKGNSIYLVDYVRNTTLKNIQFNSQASIAFVNLESLKGYQLNGVVEVLKKDKKNNYSKLLLEYQQKQLTLSTRRLIKALHGRGKSSGYEAEFPKRVAILKVKINEVVRIGLQGDLERENSGKI